MGWPNIKISTKISNFWLSFRNFIKFQHEMNHESLLKTIKKHFPEQIHHLLKSYLSNRIFVVKIKDVYSEVKDIKTGISREASWPILPNRTDIMRTIHGQHTNSTILTFVDDTVVLVRHTNPETTVTLLQEQTTKIRKWLQDKQIKANPSECNNITFTLRKRKLPKYPIEWHAHSTNKAS